MRAVMQFAVLSNLTFPSSLLGFYLMSHNRIWAWSLLDYMVFYCCLKKSLSQKWQTAMTNWKQMIILAIYVHNETVGLESDSKSVVISLESMKLHRFK